VPAAAGRPKPHASGRLFSTTVVHHVDGECHMSVASVDWEYYPTAASVFTSPLLTTYIVITLIELLFRKPTILT
jgi:hypothetical protein